MSKGDNLAEKRRQILVVLLEAKAVDVTSRVKREDIGKEVGLVGNELQSALRTLKGLGWVDWLRKDGTWQCYLTPVGLTKAELLVSEVRDDVEPLSKGRIGFREPGEERGPGEEVG